MKYLLMFIVVCSAASACSNDNLSSQGDGPTPGPSPRDCAPHFELIRLGHFGGHLSYAYDVNEDGVAVGNSYTAPNSSGARQVHAFRFTQATGMERLGDLTSPTYAYGINDDGDITGNAQVPMHDRAFRVLSQAPQTMQLYAPPDDRFDAKGWAINAQGVISGDCYTHVSEAEACRFYPDGTVEPLGLFPGGVFVSSSFDIADDNTIVGIAFVDGGRDRHAVRYDDTSGWFDIGALIHDGFSSAYGISDDGRWIVGIATYSTANGTEGFRYTDASGPEQVLGLGGDYTQPLDINNHGDIVGIATDVNGKRAFYYDASLDTNHDLHDLIDDPNNDLYLSDARRISNSGYVVGTLVTDDNGLMIDEGYILKPLAGCRE